MKGLGAERRNATQEGLHKRASEELGQFVVILPSETSRSRPMYVMILVRVVDDAPLVISANGQLRGTEGRESRSVIL